MKDKLCTSCGYIGKPTTQGVGSFAVDAVIWLTALVVSFFTGIFAFMFIALAWTIYHLALYRTTTCPKCGNIAMVSQTSHKAQEYRDRPTIATVYEKRPQQ